METIGGVNAANAAAANATGNEAMKGLDGEAFLKLFVAQLKYQDPLAPNKGAEMMQQTAVFTQVETMKSMAATQQQLMGFQQVTLASSLVGKSVTADLDGVDVTGIVTGFRITADGPMLQLDTGEEVGLERATEVRSPT